ncbi:hypothetical protein SCYAM73S_06822 [Streptomyces cyaneofuscatus]
MRARATANGTPLVRAVAARAGDWQIHSEQPVDDPPLRGGLQFVPQGTVAQHRLGAEQPFDDGQSTGDVPVVEAFADTGETVRPSVRLVDGLEAGQRSTGQGDQQFFSADLGRVVVQRSQSPLDQADPVLRSPAFHEAPGFRPVAGAGARSCRSRLRKIRYEGPRDQRVQLTGLDGPGTEQLEVGQHPGRRIRQHR